MKKILVILLLFSNHLILFSQSDSLFRQLMMFELVKTNELELNDSSLFKVSGLQSKSFMFEPIDYYRIPNLQLCSEKRDTIINSRQILYMGEIIPLDSNLYLINYRYRSLNKFFSDTCTIVKVHNSFGAFPIDKFKPEEIIQALNDGKMNLYTFAFFHASTDDRQAAYVCKLENGSYVIYGD